MVAMRLVGPAMVAVLEYFKWSDSMLHNTFSSMMLRHQKSRHLYMAFCKILNQTWRKRSLHAEHLWTFARQLAVEELETRMQLVAQNNSLLNARGPDEKTPLHWLSPSG